jgi:hypothetical protein
LRVEGERVGEHGWVHVQEVCRLHDGRAAWNGPLFVNEIFMGCDAGLAGRYAMGDAEAFGYHGRLVAVSKRVIILEWDGCVRDTVAPLIAEVSLCYQYWVTRS